MKALLILLLLYTIGVADLKKNQWYSCISADDKGEIFIKKVSPVHIIGDDIDLWLQANKKLYVGINGFQEYVVIGEIPRTDKKIIFGTSTIEAETWNCTPIYGKVPFVEKIEKDLK